MPATVRIRLPAPLRAYIVVFGLVWLGLVSRGFMSAFPAPESLIGVVMLAFGGGLMYRMLRLGVWADGDGLLVRNQLRTQQLAWDEIEDFRVGTPGGMPFGKVIYALLDDGGMTTLDVTMRWGLLPRSRRSLETLHAQLREWLPRPDTSA